MSALPWRILNMLNVTGPKNAVDSFETPSRAQAVEDRILLSSMRTGNIEIKKAIKQSRAAIAFARDAIALVDRLRDHYQGPHSLDLPRNLC
jgi:hypothetical protein